MAATSTVDSALSRETVPRNGRSDQGSQVRIGPRSVGPSPDPDRTASLIARVQGSRDERALAEVMAAYDWLAVACARRMQRRGEPREDLEQVAREALLGAVQRFDPTRDSTFKAFAWATVEGVLRRHYRGRWQVHVPRGLQELHLRALGAIDILTAANRRVPTMDEVAAHLHVDREDVVLALDAGHAYRAGSIEPAAGQPPRPSRAAETALTAHDHRLDTTVERVFIRGLLAELPERQRSILVMHFFDGRTQAEIAEHLGISQVHVSRLLRAALTLLRAHYEAA